MSTAGNAYCPECYCYGIGVHYAGCSRLERGWSVPIGWLCQKCGASYGPAQTECYRCNNSLTMQPAAAQEREP